MSIGNSNIHQVSEIPEITKLPNGRLRVVRRFNKFTREDVDNANLGSLMGDFGDLDTTGEQIVNQGYTNLRLISVEVDNRFNAVTNNSNPVLVKTYETLTSSFVQVTDEDQIEELESGIKRLTRVLRAQSGTTYSGDVGTTNAGGSNTQFLLAKSDLKDSGSFAELTLSFLTSGITDVREDIVGSQKAIVITKVAVEPTTNDASTKSDITHDGAGDWSIARKDVTQEGGLEIYTYTFLLDNTVLSQSQDKKGSLKTEVIEVYNPKVTIDGLAVDGGSTVAGNYFLSLTALNGKNWYQQSQGDFYAKNISYTGSEWRLGQYTGVYGVSTDTNPDNPLDPPSTGWSGIGNNEVTNITIREFDQTLPSSTSGFELSHRYDKEGYSLIGLQQSNIDGIPTMQYTFAKDNSIVSVTEDKVGSQTAIVNEVFNPTSESITGVDTDNVALSGYVEADRTESDYEGIKTIRVRFLKNNVTLSTSEDKVGSQLAIVKEVFNGTPATPSGYSIADESISNIDGIPTRRFRFLKNNVTLSTSEDKIGSQLAIVKEVFNGTPSTPSGYSIADEQISSVDGIATKRFRFLKNNVQLSKSVDNQSPLLTEVREYFKPDSSKETLTGYSLISKQESNVDGIPTERYTFAKNDVMLSRSLDSESPLLTEVIEYFEPADGRLLAYNQQSNPGGVPTGKVLTNKAESNVDGMPTERYTFKKTGAILSRSYELVGSQEAVVISKFGSEPTVAEAVAFGGDGYTIAKKEESGTTNQKTFTYTFLQSDVVLSRSKDSVGSQKAVVLEVFNGDNENSDANAYGAGASYVLAKEEESNIDGINTKRYTYLQPSILSRTDDKKDPACPITIVAFNIDETSNSIYHDTGSPQVDSNNYVLVSKTERDFEGLETFEMRFEKKAYLLSEKENEFGRIENVVVEQGATTYALRAMPGSVTTVNGTANSYIIAQEITEGIVPRRTTTYSTAGIESVSEDLVGATKVITITSFITAPTASNASTYSNDVTDVPANFVLISDTNNRINGVDLFTYRFARKNAIVSTSYDLVGSQKAFVVEKFGDSAPTTSETINSVVLTDYSLARKDESNVEGIKTFRYTFLQPGILSVSQDFVEDVNTIQVTAFSKTESEVKTALSEVTTNHKLIRQSEQNHDGIETTTFTFEINTSDVIRYTSNNRLEVVRTIYEAHDYDYNANYDIGSTSIDFTHPNNTTTNLVLSELRVNKRGATGTFVKLEALFTEPGESARSESTGPQSMPGTEKITIASSGSTPVVLTETDDIKLVNKQQQNNNGFSTFIRSYIKGTDATSTTINYASGRTYKVNSNGNYSSVGGPNPGIIGDYFQATSNATLGSGVTAYLVGQIIGDKVSYENIVSVQVPGTVKCVKYEAVGSLSSNNYNNNSSQTIIESIPSNTIKIVANVKESIQTSIPEVVTLAYNLDNISCSVAKIGSNRQVRYGPAVKANNGRNTAVGTQVGASLTTSNIYYPGSYILENDNTAIVATDAIKGRQYKVVSIGTTDFTAIGGSNTVESVFVATGAGTGTGTIKDFGQDAILEYQSSYVPNPTGNEESGSFGSLLGHAEHITTLITSGATGDSSGNPPSSYTTTGTIQQKARPVLTTLDGTTYYEVIKFSKDS